MEHLFHSPKVSDLFNGEHVVLEQREMAAPEARGA
jgi:hypothetical protein